MHYRGRFVLADTNELAELEALAGEELVSFPAGPGYDSDGRIYDTSSDHTPVKYLVPQLETRTGKFVCLTSYQYAAHFEHNPPPPEEWEEGETLSDYQDLWVPNQGGGATYLRDMPEGVNSLIEDRAQVTQNVKKILSKQQSVTDKAQNKLDALQAKLTDALSKVQELEARLAEYEPPARMGGGLCQAGFDFEGED